MCCTFNGEHSAVSIWGWSVRIGIYFAVEERIFGKQAGLHTNKNVAQIWTLRINKQITYIHFILNANVNIIYVGRI